MLKTEGTLRVRRAEFVEPRSRFECVEKGNGAVGALAEVAEVDGSDGSTPLNLVPRELTSIRQPGRERDNALFNSYSPQFESDPLD